MKLLYNFRNALALFGLLLGLNFTLLAQGTSPTPQVLPYYQDFTNLSSTSTTFPSGFQGWNVASFPSAAYNRSGIITEDKTLVAGSASSTAGNIYNYNGKIGFLNTGSVDLTIGFAFSSVGKNAIQVQYDAMTIRNPASGSSTRINELILQYRVGTENSFVSIAETAYTNTLDSQTGSGVTTPQNPQTFKVTLPSECDNQSVVQLRWISRQNSGSGSRPSFAIDNISIINDTTPPSTITGFPKADAILSDGFDFVNQLNESGKTYFVFVADGGNEPTKAQIKAGLNASNNTALRSGFLAIVNANESYSTSFTDLALGTSYIVYSVSEDSNGNIQTTTNKLNVSTSATLVPSIRTSASTLNFGFQEQGFSSNALTFTVQGMNITNNVTVTAPANFTVSKDNINFQSSVVYTTADFVMNATLTIYTRFMPSTTTTYSGGISIESMGATTKTILVNGKGINPYLQDFNDPDVLINSGWTVYNEKGATNTWATTTTARNLNSAPGAVVMNGYSDSDASSDWLISPKLHLSSFDKFALLSFYSRKYYAGASLKLMVSTDYDGVSSPTTATWTAIEGSFPTTTDVYTKSDFINLESYKTDNTYVAWLYETTKGGTNYAAEWSVDDIAFTNAATFLSANPTIDFDDVAVNSVSASKSFMVVAGGYGNLTLTAPTDYQISLDNNTFESSVVLSAAEALSGKTVYARFTPTSKAIAITGSITIMGTGISQQVGVLKGSSLPKSETFDIVTYNLEFFGSDVIGSSGTEFGPVNDPLQIDNVAAVMNKLDADVYVVQEVSDDTALETLIGKISINGKTFDKSVSTSWSYSFNAPQADFPPQKLVVLYNTQTATVKSTKVIFKELYDGIRAGNATLPNYPDANASSFFSSGRLPYLVKIETNLNGVKKEISLIDIHARANSGTDISKYNMRKYDIEYLKDELDKNYATDNLVILGDFNDDVKTSVIAGNPSSYQKIVEDTANYTALTLGISQQGAYTYLSSSGFLDHIVISNELNSDYIPNSIAVYDPRNDIPNYITTTSDHGPVIARFSFRTTLSTNTFGNEMRYANVSPNPMQNVINIDVNSDNNSQLTFKLYDSLGRAVGSDVKIDSSKMNQGVINVANLPTGIYFYTLSEANKIVQKGKLIKQ
ncbi:T9SS type A sorting domain-containing protein [Flavobacterium algicola]|uniref:T9SS type A sorting domain-containing protein n=1 Tax=Flavobacterium algicola TaxID=556529 RepID=UPI001EFE1632|nr:T9SS type A sorting domain-containing protein [Flavobacterium algicola]MCG9792549.1 T9SS type A sorting domain-containing protein [Flavobacterium algicola]